MAIKAVSKKIDLQFVSVWVLLAAVVVFHTPIEAKDGEKEPVSGESKEEMIDGAKEMEGSDQDEVGEANYNVQDCEPMHADDNDTESDSEVDSDDLDECKRVVK